MLKVAILVWIMLGATLAGVAVMFVLNWPAFSGQELKLIPVAAIVGYIVALPFSGMIAKAIVKNMA